MARARTSAPRQGLGRASAAVVLAAALALAGAPGARAVDEITTQEYVAALGVDNEAVADYADGLLATETVFDNDPAYTYRGTNPTTINAHPDRTALDTSPRYHKTRLRLRTPGRLNGPAQWRRHRRHPR